MHRGTVHRRQRARSEPPLASAVNGGSGGGEAGVGLRPAIILYYEIILLKLEVLVSASQVLILGGGWTAALPLVSPNRQRPRVEPAPAPLTTVIATDHNILSSLYYY